MNTRKLRIALTAVIAIIFCLVSFPAVAASPKQIYKKAGPGVVFILASEGSQMGSVGTGSIIRTDGLVITNAHVFAKPNSSRLKSDIAVFLKPGRVTGNHKRDLSHRYKGTILAYDTPLDLALLKITGVEAPLTTVEFADSDEVDIGDKVYAIGHPEQGGLWSLTSGVISAYRADFGGVTGKNLFQTDASINRGNSGGPLLDEQGDMVGINSMIARKAANGLTITDVNYSIMSNVAVNWLAGLGYTLPVNRQTTPEPSGEAADTPKQTEEKSIQPKTEEKVQPSQDQPVKEKVTPQKEVVTSPEKTEEKSTQPKEYKPVKEAKKTQKSGGGKILTKKKPYKMSKLLRDIQEMEDMMEEMRGKIKRQKEKKW
ncbi:MAG: trypsin-like peptidase domain-containing protein [Deltaproteobacteria bacterium]|nr:MAG: trypsin-like peptidase domain-containing protein [Deltaproteobacteria bacterium]